MYYLVSYIVNYRYDPNDGRYSISWVGPCKVRNEIKMKRNETKQIEINRNETKQIETKWNKSKYNETNEICFSHLNNLIAHRQF